MEVQRVEQTWQEFIQKDNKGQSKCFDLLIVYLSL